MIILFYIAFIILAAYCLFIAYIAFFVKRQDPDKRAVPAKVSVIIPCRDEADNIGRCLQSLTKQTLPVSQFEVIVVDDFSGDHTVKIAEQFKGKLSLTILQNNIAGKKNALALGIVYAGNEIIITTDADCTMHSGWLSGMLNEFENNKLNMLCGPINFNGNGSLFENLQQAESAAIVGISATMLNRRYPTTCNGANLMFRKSVFDGLGGYMKHSFLATGDDDLLMQEFYRQDPAKVKYCLNREAMVYTNACEGFNQFLHQRTRWLAKRQHYIYKGNAYLQLLIFSQLLAFYLLLYVSISDGNILAIAMLSCKYMVDLIYGTRLRSIFRFNLFHILLMPFFECYIFIVLFVSLFKKKKWKGRDI